jgi:hypothetical protein
MATKDKVETNGSETAAHRQVFPTLDDARACKPESERLREFEVFEDDKSRGFVWAGSVNEALVVLARQDGYSAKVAEPKAGGPFTKEKVAARLGDFTDEELAAMGLSRKKAKK